MALFNLLAKLGLDATAYSSGLKRAESQAESFGRQVKGYLAQSLSLATAAKLGYDIAQLAQGLKDTSEQLQITTVEAQKLAYFAKDAGVSGEFVSASLLKIGEAQAKALAGDAGAVAQFHRLGVSIDTLATSSKWQVFEQIGRALGDATKQAEAQDAAIDLLGVKSQRLFTAMSGMQGAGPLVIVTDEQVNAVDAAAKALETARIEATSLATVLAGKELTRKAGFIAGALGGASKFAQAAGFDDVAKRLRSAASRVGSLGAAEPTTPSRQTATATEDLSKFIGRSAEAVGPLSPIMSGINKSQDPLARIGGLFFGADGSGQSLMRQQLNVLQRLDARVARLERVAE